MGTIVSDCPHCGTKHASHIIFGRQVASEAKKVRSNTNSHHFRWSVYVGAVCSGCDGPSVATLKTDRDYPGHAHAIQHSAELTKDLQNIEHYGFSAVEIWPAPPEPSIPAFLTPAIERSLLQAERNFPIEGNEEAAAIMYRRSLELAVKEKAPDIGGSLASRIKKMVANHDLTPAIGEWATEIRLLGNDAAHDMGNIDREELGMVRGFADAVLRYLYTLPAEVAARRKVPSDTAEPDEI